MLAQISNSGLELGGLFNGLKVQVDKYEEIISKFRNIESFDDFVLPDGKADWDAIAKAIGGADERAISYFKTLDDGKGTINNTSASIDGMSAYLESTGQSFDFAAVKATLFNTALNAGIFLVVSLAIQGVIKAIDSYVHASEKAIELTDELKSKHDELKSEFDSHKKTVDELASTYEKLSKGVDTLTNKNIDLSDEDYEEYLRITNELAEAFPSLYQTLDDNGNAILTLGQNGRTASEDLRELLKAEEDLNNYKISQDIDGLFGGVKVKIDEAKESIDEYKASSEEMENAFQTLKELSTDGIDLFNEDNLSLSVDTSTQSGIEYYNALTKALQNFNKELDANRRVELDGLFDPANVTTQTGDNAFQFYLNLWQLTDEEKQQLQNEIKSQASDILPLVQDEISSTFTEQSQKQQEADLAWRDFLPSLVATMKSKGSFKDLANKEFGEDIQNFAVDIVSNLDRSVAEEMDKNDPYSWVRDNIILPLTQLSEEDRKSVSNAYKKLLELNPNDLSEANQSAIDKLIKVLAEMLGQSEVDIRLNLGFKVDENLKSKYDNAVKNASENLGIAKDETEKIFTELGIDTTAEIDRWNKITAGIDDATEAKKKYLAENKNADEMTVPLSVSDTIDQLNTQLKPAFDSLKSAYQDIFTKDGFTLDNVDISMLDNIKLKIDELNNNEELNIKIDYSSFDDLAKVLTDSSSTADDVQNAFNNFAGTIVNSLNPALGQTTGENYKLVQSLLESVGVINSEAVMISSLGYSYEEYSAAKEECANAGFDLANATEEEINGFIAEQGGAENCGVALATLQLKKLLVNSATINTSTDIQQILSLANAANISTNSLIALANAKAQFETASANGDKQGMALAARGIRETTAKVKEDILNFEPVKFEPPASGSKSGGSKKDAWKEAYEKELAELEHLHEMGLISDEEYYNQRIALNEKYFGEASGKHEKYLDEYRKNEEQIADGLKKLWEDYWNDYKDNLDKVSSYAEKLFQRQIDELNKKKDNSDDSYEKEIESIESVIKRLEDKRDKEKEYWQDQIDAIQKEIDSLQDANDERERALNLQKKMYELQRAMAQRSILQYSQEKGFHYVTNDSEIKDKKEEVDQAKFDITIANLQKQKDALEDKLDEITDKYDVQIEKLNYRKETVEKNMDAENKRIQEQIDLLEEQKSKWTEVADNIEFALLEREMMSKYGSDVAQKILGGDVQFLNDFISQYEHATGVINSLNDATLNDIMNMAGQFGVYAENLGGVADIAKEAADKQAEASAQVTQASDSMDTSNMQSQIANAGSSADTASAQMQGVVDKLNGLATEASNISIPALNSSDFASSVEGVIKQLEELKGKFSTISDEIKGSWNNMIGGIVGTSSSGNGDPLAGGASSSSYSELFTPLEKEIDAANLIIDGKLKELQGLWTQFQGNLAGIIGVGDSTGGSGGQTGVPSISLNAGESKGKSSDKGKESKSEASGADTIVGAIQAGGQMIDDTFNNEWIPSFSSMGSNINDICRKIVACVNEMAEETVNACRAAIEAINEANAAKNSSSSNNEKPPKFEGSAYVGQAFAKGSDDIAIDKDQTVLLNELGEEGIIRDGKLNKVIGGAQFHDVKKGDIILNHKQMEELETNGKITSGNKHGKLVGSFAKGTIDPSDIEYPEWILGRDGQKYYPLQPGDKDYELFQKFQDYMEQNQMQIIPPVNSIQKEVAAISRSVSNVNTRNTQQAIQFSTGDIIVQGVQNVDGFAKAIKTHFPNAMIQALNTTR